MDTMALKKRRCEKGFFTQVSLARQIGMSAENYGNRERGRVRFTADELSRLCEALDWTLEEGLRHLS